MLGSNGSGEAEEPCGSFVSVPHSRAPGRARGWAEHNLGIFPRAWTLLASPWKVWLFLESWGAVLAKQAAFGVVVVQVLLSGTVTRLLSLAAPSRVLSKVSPSSGVCVVPCSDFPLPLSTVCCQIHSLGRFPWGCKPAPKSRASALCPASSSWMCLEVAWEEQELWVWPKPAAGEGSGCSQPSDRSPQSNQCFFRDITVSGMLPSPARTTILRLVGVLQALGEQGGIGVDGVQREGELRKFKTGTGSPPSTLLLPPASPEWGRSHTKPCRVLPAMGKLLLMTLHRAPPRFQLQIPSQPRSQRHPLCPEQSSHPTRDLQPSWEAVGGG